MGYEPYRPEYISAIMAVASILSAKWTDPAPAVCNSARCGLSRLGHARDTTVYAGMIPQVIIPPVTVAITELPGEPADPRQEYDTAYDNPSYTVHIIGDDLEVLDTVAHEIRAGADRTAHITTAYGTVNTLSVGPPSRTVRGARPRYDVQMTVNAEFIREEVSEA